MKTPLSLLVPIRTSRVDWAARSLPHLLGALATALFLSSALLGQEKPPGEPPPPPPPPAAVAPTAPVPPAETPAAVAPTAPAAPVPAAAETTGEAERPLRRLDEPAATDSKSSKKVVPARGSRSPRAKGAGGSGEPPFGDHTVAKGRKVREAVSIMGATVVEGEVERDAVSVLGRTVIGPGAKVGGSAVAVLGPLESKGSIGNDAVSVLGGVDLDGPVKGEVVSVLGDVRLGPNAVVQRDIVVVGGKLQRDPAAIVHGHQVNIPVLGSMGDTTWLSTWFKRCVLLGRPLAFGEHMGWAWLVALSFLGFYFLLAVLFRGGFERCVTVLETRPGMSLLSSLLTVLLSPVVIVLLIATVVGLLIVPFVALGLFFASFFGKAVMLAWLGRRVTRLAGGDTWGHPAVAVLIGGAIVLLLYTVPVFGFLLFKLLGWVGLGVVVYTIALAMKRETPPPPAAGVASVGGVPPPVAPTAAPAPTMSAGFGSEAAVSGAAVGGATGETPLAMGFTAPQAEFTRAAETGTPAAAPVAAPVIPPFAGAALPPPGAAARAVPVSSSTLPRAGFFIRLGALALDGLLVGMIVGFISGLLPRFLQISNGPGGFLLALAAYGAIMWKHRGTTIGGIVFGLKVVRIDNREIDWATAIVRALGCFLSLIVAGFGFIWVAFDDEKQSWHDKIAGTTVVRVPKGVSLL